MKKTTLFIGLNDQYTKKQQISTSKAIKQVTKVVGDCSISVIHGVYKNILENTLKVDIYNLKNDVTILCNNLKDFLNQESILVEHTEVQASFV